MATRVTSTTSASSSLGGTYFTSQVNSLNTKFTSNTPITASHFVDLANLLIQAAGHTHDWTDMYGMHTAGNFNSEAYSPRGSTNPNSVQAIDTDFGLLYGVSAGEVVDRSHYNYMVTVFNGLRNHHHSTDDTTS